MYVFLTSDKDDVWYHSDALDGKITDISFSGDSSHLIIGTESGRVHVYSSEGGDPMTMFQPNEVSCVAAGLNSKYYIYGTSEGMLTLFDGVIGADIWQKNIGGEIKDCVFNGRSTYVFAGSDNKKIVFRMMCEIICADGLIDPFESNLIRRLSGLLYISDKDAGIIKKQVMKKKDM